MKKKMGAPTTNMNKEFSADAQNVGDNGGRGARTGSGSEDRAKGDGGEAKRQKTGSAKSGSGKK